MCVWFRYYPVCFADSPLGGVAVVREALAERYGCGGGVQVSFQGGQA